MNDRKKVFAERSNKPIKKSFKDTVWVFLNSNFGMFILGSVMLGAITNIVSANIQDRQEKMEKRKQVLRYANEFNLRLTKLESVQVDYRNAYYVVGYAEQSQSMENIFEYVRENKLISQKVKDSTLKAIDEWEKKKESLKEEMFGCETTQESIIAATNKFHPTEKNFEGQHLVSIISWFRFNLDEKIDVKRELQALSIIEERVSLGDRVEEADSIRNQSFLILHQFVNKLQSYLDRE